jgi:hypothetical protein
MLNCGMLVLREGKCTSSCLLTFLCSRPLPWPTQSHLRHKRKCGSEWKQTGDSSNLLEGSLSRAQHPRPSPLVGPSTAISMGQRK